MTIPAFLRNYRRLLALVLASALVHALALLLIAYVPATSTPEYTPSRLVIAARIAPAPAEAVTSAPSPLPPAPAPEAAAASGASAAANAESPAAPATVAGIESGDAFGVQVDAAMLISQAAELPGSQNTRVPASATIRYEVQRRAAANAAWSPGGAASLAWQRRSTDYTLTVESTPPGAPAPSRSISSEGILGDAGILPVRSRETGVDGERDTLFDRDTDRISFSGSDRTSPVGAASQDQASMLMQLAAMANADPAQLEGAVSLHVGGSGNAGVVRFEFVGVERVETPMGTLQALHLAQKADAGRTRLDIWLAPGHDYLPVKLLSRLGDGSEVLQAATSITR